MRCLTALAAAAAAVPWTLGSSSRCAWAVTRVHGAPWLMLRVVQVCPCATCLGSSLLWSALCRAANAKRWDDLWFAGLPAMQSNWISIRASINTLVWNGIKRTVASSVSAHLESHSKPVHTFTLWFTMCLQDFASGTPTCSGTVTQGHTPCRLCAPSGCNMPGLEMGGHNPL